LAKKSENKSKKELEDLKELEKLYIAP